MNDDEALHEAEQMLAALCGLLAEAVRHADDEPFTLTADEAAGVRRILQRVRGLIADARG